MTDRKVGLFVTKIFITQIFIKVSIMSNTQEKPLVHTEEQLLFIDKLKAGAFPHLDCYLTINNYFDLNNDGEFSHVDTHVAYMVFLTGYQAGKNSGVLVEDPSEVKGKVNALDHVDLNLD